MKTITKNLLKKHNASKDAVTWVLEQKDKSIKSLFKQGIKDNKLDYLNWGLCRTFNRKQRIQYAVYAAKQVLPIFEKKYPTDTRPRQAIKAAIECINNNTKKIGTLLLILLLLVLLLVLKTS